MGAQKTITVSSFQQALNAMNKLGSCAIRGDRQVMTLHTERHRVGGGGLKYNLKLRLGCQK